MKVFKFGGASVKDAAAIRNMVSIVQSFEGPLVIVVSAIGENDQCDGSALDSLCRS